MRLEYNYATLYVYFEKETTRFTDKEKKKKQHIIIA